ncbi:uncharacterized protein UTRI_04218_B [Ustilago trichophora]|uniref:J domain-containing protein n=1 Tax=Ustilago trichophora TaxID=86804 RepID=A0A5C3EAU4_9BASI|nr:uncharacterized protein UTRI_04218_B [Ustilago trichophora]
MKADILQFTSLLTWWWLPSLGSQLLLNFCYSFQILSPPPPSAPRLRNKHLQLARTAVILGTLFYQLYVSISTASPNYYQLLALPLDVDSEGVKRSFRALARKYHPDKVGPLGEEFFILLRRSHDILSDPAKRFAYDRFGPSIAEWKDCESPRDFMRRGLLGLVAFYTINPAMYALFGYLNGSRSNGISFWRLSGLFALLAAELSTIVSPDYPTWLAVLMPNTTIHDVRELSHSLFVNFFFASLQLCATLDVLEYGEEGAPARDGKSKVARAERQMEVVRAKTQMLDATAEMVKAGMVQGFARELRAFRGGEKGKMGEMEERLFEKIDDVLLCRSLVQQHAQLMALGGKSRGEEAVPEQLVKQEQAETAAPPSAFQSVKVKEEPVELSIANDVLPTTSAHEPIPVVEIKKEDDEQITSITAATTDSSNVAVKQESTQSSTDAETTSTEPWIHLDEPFDSQPSIEHPTLPMTQLPQDDTLVASEAFGMNPEFGETSHLITTTTTTTTTTPTIATIQGNSSTETDVSRPNPSDIVEATT